MAKKETAQKATVKAPALFVGATDIDKAIRSIHSRGAKLSEDIQKAGLSILMHVDEHGDTTLADRLYNAMPKGTKRNGLAAWFIAFGKMRVLQSSSKDDASAIKAGRVFQYEKDRKTSFDAAVEKPWHAMQKDAPVQSTFDVQAAWQQLLNRIKKAQSDGLTIEHADLIERIEQVIQPVEVK